MKRLLLILLILSATTGGLYSQYAKALFFGPAQTATVTVNLASTGYTIPSSFVGWSVENQDLIAGYYDGTTAAGISLSSLAHLLGTNGIVRIGGITSDTASAPGLPALTQQMATNYNTFRALLGSGWTTIYGLDACDNSAAHALTQAGYLITALGVGNVTFQVGNEPPFEVCGFSQGTWTTTYDTYRSTIIGTYATARFAGPDVTNNSTVQSFVNGTATGLAGMSYVTSHWYPYGIGFTPVADQLLSSVYLNDTVSTVNSYAFQSNSSYATGKLMMTESSDRAGCGLQGVTDRLMTSAWYLNIAITLANDGWIGFQPHNAIATCYGQAHNGYYNPFVLQGDGGFSPSPMFYGMYLFSQIEGQVTATIAKTGTAYIKAIATVGTGGNANILVQNNSTTFPVRVTPAQSAAWTSATVLQLTGAACDDANPKLGGAVIGESGTWTGAATTILNGATVLLPPCGAALIKIQP